MSLLIVKGQAGMLCVTASELSTSDSDEYRFVFKEDTQRKNYEVTLTDISDYKHSYNLFAFTEGTTLTLPTGNYEYFVYDSNDVLVERSKAIVIPANEATKYSFPYTNQNNYLPS